MTAKKKSEIDEARINEVLASVPMTELSYKDMSMKPADHQFLVRLMNMRDEETEDRILEKVKKFYLADNANICKNVANTVSIQLGKTLVPILTKLEALAEGQNKIAQDIIGIKSDILNIKETQKKIEDKVDYEDKRLLIVEERLDKKKEKIDRIERAIKILPIEKIQQLANKIDMLMPEVQDLKPEVTRLSRTQRWWNISLRILIGVIIGATFTIVYVETRSRNIIKETVYETMETLKSGE